MKIVFNDEFLHQKSYPIEVFTAEISGLAAWTRVAHNVFVSGCDKSLMVISHLSEISGKCDCGRPIIEKKEEETSSPDQEEAHP